MAGNVGSRLIYGSVLEDGTKFQSISQTLAATTSLARGAPPLLFIIPGADGQKLLLHAPVASDKGLFYIIVNTSGSAHALAVRTFDDGAAVVSIAQNTIGLVVTDGVTWWNALMAAA